MMTETLRGQGAIVSKPAGPSNGRPVQASPLSSATKKILVCAPSNAAVDELVMRFKDGIKTLDGRNEKLSVVRLGRSDAINANIKDVTLEELVNAKLNLAAPRNGSDRDIHELMMEHKEASDKLQSLRAQLDECRRKGESVSQADSEAFEGLKKRKGQLSLEIDRARDKQKTASRDAELERRRVQQSILDSAHVLCATLSGSGHEIFQSLNLEFETVIIDEAAQSIELSALIPLKYGCSKCILVGDPKQLPPTVLSREAARFQFEQSLFARMEKNHPGDVHLLDTQYRMHPEISLFPSKMFYESRLRDGVDMAKLRARPWHHAPLLAPYRFFDVQGMQSSASKGHSLVNVAESEVAMKLYDRLITDCGQYDFKRKIGIITPYKGQLRELRARFARRYGENITSSVDFNTTDAFQGRESEIIIFSCVRATTKGIGFLSDIRRMNVGLTRAKCSLWVLGDSKTLVKGEFWNSLISDAKARDLYTEGNILQLLGRPILTKEMMRDDVEMEDVGPTAPPAQVRAMASLPTVARQAGSDKNEASGIGGGPAPPSRPSSGTVSQARPSQLTSSRSNEHSAAWSGISRQGSSQGQTGSTLSDIKSKEARLGIGAIGRQGSLGEVYGPSGGRTGLNGLAVCRICGSDNHFSHACGNEAARLASHGQCVRCHSCDHAWWDCVEARCLECGEVGHSQEDCRAPGNHRFSKAEKARVRRQEEEFPREKARVRQRRAEKQLGEHGAKIPTVKSTLPENANGRGSGAVNILSKGPTTDTKRKREHVLAGDETREAKAVKDSDRSRNTVDLTGDDKLVMQGPSGMQQRGPEASSRPLGAIKRSGPNGGSMVKKKAKDSDVFMKRR